MFEVNEDLLAKENSIYIKCQYIFIGILINRKTISDFIFTIINWLITISSHSTLLALIKPSLGASTYTTCICLIELEQLLFLLL